MISRLPLRAGALWRFLAGLALWVTHVSRDIDAVYQFDDILAAGVLGAADKMEAVAGDAGQYRLYVFRQYHAATGDKGPGTGRSEQGEGGTRAEAVNEFRAVARCLDQVLYVVQQCGRNVHCPRLLLQRCQLLGAKAGGQFRQLFPSSPPFQQGALSLPVRVAECDAHEKTVKL